MRILEEHLSLLIRIRANSFTKTKCHRLNDREMLGETMVVHLLQPSQNIDAFMQQNP
jgi:hypothetical protein